MGEAGMMVTLSQRKWGWGMSIVPIHQPFLKKSFLFWIDFRLPKNRCHRHTNEYK